MRRMKPIKSVPHARARLERGTNTSGSDARRQRLRRAALHLPVRRSERDVCYYLDRLPSPNGLRWLLLLAVTSAFVAGQGDFLTEQEAIKIQEAQELLPRTEQYLGFAAARSAEIGRRTGKTYAISVPGVKAKESRKDKNKEKKEKEKAAEAKNGRPGDPGQSGAENPLLFFQLSDLVRGMSQSLRAVMTNVDERFEYKRSDPKEIVQSLKLLHDFVSQDFASLCRDLEQRSLQKDPELYKAVRDLREEVERAANGAKKGLTVLGGVNGDTLVIVCKGPVDIDCAATSGTYLDGGHRAD